MTVCDCDVVPMMFYIIVHILIIYLINQYDVVLLQAFQPMAAQLSFENCAAISEMVCNNIIWLSLCWHHFYTLRPRQNGRHLSGDIFKCIFLNENIWFFIKISLKFVPKGPINDIPALVQIMAWRRLGNKPLSEPIVDRLPMHLCVTRPQWVKKCSTKVVCFSSNWLTGIPASKISPVSNRMNSVQHWLDIITFIFVIIVIIIVVFIIIIVPAKHDISETSPWLLKIVT